MHTGDTIWSSAEDNRGWEEGAPSLLSRSQQNCLFLQLAEILAGLSIGHIFIHVFLRFSVPLVDRSVNKLLQVPESEVQSFSKTPGSGREEAYRVLSVYSI